MNRRKFCQSVVCAAVVAALPGEQWTRSWDADVWKSTHGRIITDEALTEAGFTHDDTHPNMQFCNTVWWQYGKPDIMVADEIVIKQLQEAWRACERV